MKTELLRQIRAESRLAELEAENARLRAALSSAAGRMHAASVFTKANAGHDFGLTQWAKEARGALS